MKNGKVPHAEGGRSRRDVILQCREKLLQSARELGISLPEMSGVTYGDEAELATSEEGIHNAANSWERESAKYEKIYAALQLMRLGAYGICNSCGENIPVARLKAAPEEIDCIECKKEQESAHGRNGRSSSGAKAFERLHAFGHNTSMSAGDMPTRRVEE